MNNLNVLQVETTNFCNSKCVFCPHSKFTEFGTMTDNLYEKIIKEAFELPRLECFIPMLTGEPLCDPQFIDRLKLAREKLPQVRIEVYTNGHSLTRGIIDKLKTINDLHISVSLNGICAETRKAMMGLDDFFKVTQMLKYMQDIGLPYRSTMVAYPEIKLGEIQEFVERGGMAIQYQSWCGEMFPYKRRRWTCCSRALTTMTINYKGEAVLCCFDPFSKMIFGDLNNESIGAIWTSSKHRQLQSMHRQGRGNKLPLCESCTEG